MYLSPANEDTGEKPILTEELFVKISNGDNKAFAYLYTNTYQAVYGFLRLPEIRFFRCNWVRCF